ncbi:MAG TPA: hypothetical protein VFR94_24305 [Nitrososphaeraceae archaeon]|nr:hypothetical protein [Nitrososphaeraceae archaeon]
MTIKVLCDGQVINGVQELQYKITKNGAIVGSNERTSASGALSVEVVIKVRSSFEELDKKMYEGIDGIKPFQIVVRFGKKGKGNPAKQISFDDCILEEKFVGMDGRGVATTTYKISSTRVKEE